MSASDPFYLVKEEIQDTVSTPRFMAEIDDVLFSGDMFRLSMWEWFLEDRVFLRNWDGF